MAKPQTDLFRGLSESEEAAILALGTKIHVAKDHALFRMGDPAEQMFLVLNGWISLTLPMKIRGHEENVLIEERLAGETLGWSGLIPPHRFTLNATGAAADSELIAFSRAALLAHFAANPAVAHSVMRNVGSVIGHRLQVFQTMWVREMQRSVELRYSRA
jgi:CRP-like cAMP-binding protein